jgi:arabinose-5-phosphate isomerase
MKNLQSLAQEVFRIEAAAIAALSARLDAQFEAAARRLATCKGRIVLCGMGKSGLLARQLAASFSSIGCPAIFLHPTEAIHGDLGILLEGDCFLSISNSGETDELLQILPYIQKKELPHITMVGNLNSTLARYADHVLDVAVAEEASDLQAVPMASTIATMAMGHALAAAMMSLRNFQHEDFLQFHPGGSLGRKLITPVADLMQKTDLPIVEADTNMQQLLMEISKGKLGLAVVLQDDKILGIITDGDLRRALERSEQEFFKLQAKDIMTPNPKTIEAKASIFEAEALMQKHKITALLIVENEAFLGVLAKHLIR